VLGRVRLSVCSIPERGSARSRFPCYSGLAAHRSVCSRPAAHGALDPILDTCVAAYTEELGSGLPGSWAVFFVRAVVEDPAGCLPTLAHGGEDAVAFRRSKTLGVRGDKNSGSARKYDAAPAPNSPL
jgi:hypothetical protein